MTTDRQKEILEQILIVLNNKDIWARGICEALDIIRRSGFLNHDEYMEMGNYLKSNKPTTQNQYKHFTSNRFWNLYTPNDTGFWWKSIFFNEKTRDIRIAYITELIVNTK